MKTEIPHPRLRSWRAALAALASVALVQAVVAAQYLIQFQADNGKWVCAEGGGGGAVLGADNGYPRGRVVADRNSPGIWETFILDDLNGGSLADGDTVTLRTRANGLFVAAEGGGNGMVVANRISPGGWETFTISKCNGSGTIGDGDQVALQVDNGKWICAENGGGQPLVADRSGIGSWETFTIDLSAAPGTYWSIPSYSPSFWNDAGTIQGNNNCYNYASNRRTDTYAQPGTASGTSLSLTTTSLSNALIQDGFESTTAGGTSSEGKMKVAAVIAPGFDFHFYRKDSGGNWSHKMGTDPATNLDDSSNAITNPETADRGAYTVFVGYFFTPCENSSQGASYANVK